MNEKLLHRLVKESGISYISDLHSSGNKQRILSALEKLSPDEYPVEEWEEAVGYILKQKKQKFDTPGSACLFLRRGLEHGLH